MIVPRPHTAVSFVVVLVYVSSRSELSTEDIRVLIIDGLVFEHRTRRQYARGSRSSMGVQCFEVHPRLGLSIYLVAVEHGHLVDCCGTPLESWVVFPAVLLRVRWIHIIPWVDALYTTTTITTTSTSTLTNGMDLSY